MILVGLSGYARSGKDAAAKVFVDEFGFTRVAFADKLREVLYQLDPICGSFTTLTDLGNTRFESMTVQDVIKSYGWDGYKESKYGPEIRRLLQRLGTEAGRQTLWDSIWIDAALTSFDEDARVVVTDCRFPNEAQAVKERGGVMWRVERQGVGPANAHASETGLDGWNEWDYMLLNNTDLECYQEVVRHAALSQLGL